MNYSWDYKLFIGDDSEKVRVSFAASDEFFTIAEVKAKTDEDTFKETLTSIKEHIDVKKPTDLKSFVAIVEKEIKELGTDVLSLAAAYSVDDILYLYTQGKGEIIIAREGKSQKLITGDKNASGRVKGMDYFVLANATFSKAFDTPALDKLLFNSKPQEIIETITPELKGKENAGMIALFMQATSSVKEETEEDPDEPEDNVASPVPPATSPSMDNADLPPGQSYEVEEDDDDTEEAMGSMDPVMSASSEPEMQKSMENQYPRKKFSVPKIGFKMPNIPILQGLGRGSSTGRKVTLGIVVVLLIVLGWSVFSGNARRQREKFLERVEEQRSVVIAKIEEADDLAGLNTQKSLQLLDESRAIYVELEKEAEGLDLTEEQALKDLETLIVDARQGIEKIEEGQYEEYYDLELIEKGAEAVSMYYDGEFITLLDSENGNVYVVEPEEKSATTYSVSGARDATKVAMHQDDPYIFGERIGVVKLVDQSEEEEVVSPDKEWKSIEDFWMYSGNIYLLDSGADDIHKYLVAEEGYSNINSYFGEGQPRNFSDATAMAIDSSLYVSAGDSVYKYTAGAGVNFSVSIPDASDITFEDIYTDNDTVNVYLLDKDSQRIFVTGKEGDFDKQISAGILKQADDFVVIEEIGILVLVANTIYSIEL